MKPYVLTVITLALAIFVWSQWEWILELRNENIPFFAETLYARWGHGLLFITLPLMVVQNVVTIFPIIVVIIVHYLVFGVWEGFIYSAAGSSLGALYCFYLARTALWRRISSFWQKKEQDLQRILRLLEVYGVWMIVLLRSIPVMPSNLISIAAALSPMPARTYYWSTLIGNMSMVWILSFISMPFWLQGRLDPLYIPVFLLFLSGIGAVFFRTVGLNRSREGTERE
ncbi:TVP38/TMEM64 family protein [Salisediminibacterium halotolerans]|uniref:TVP38/TMEM64 family membrane protein n=1 Tax=Salisediminibacterium halotolerans TaxID=517425 RepID=A0A1H9RVI3_9BACI|nr:VTT domain-containing protein [Salisediminibacterium haloalkalitolerans]SER76812.1 Uncharacterized membrane protein YdjX, TVP38/TMEM64 family, SNARE-associated domain [Salisediminibacterium haloalkalitolerans]